MPGGQGLEYGEPIGQPGQRRRCDLGRGLGAVEVEDQQAREEIGIEIQVGPPLVVDWIPASGPWFDGIMFIFDGGVLTDEQFAQITLDDTEARRFQFMTLDQASDRMRPSMVRRIARAQEALAQGSPIYTEYGRRPEQRAVEIVPASQRTSTGG